MLGIVSINLMELFISVIQQFAVSFANVNRFNDIFMDIAVLQLAVEALRNKLYASLSSFPMSACAGARRLSGSS